MKLVDKADRSMPVNNVDNEDLSDTDKENKEVDDKK